jgi:hypothetical protein
MQAPGSGREPNGPLQEETVCRTIQGLAARTTQCAGDSHALYTGMEANNDNATGSHHPNRVVGRLLRV